MNKYNKNKSKKTKYEHFKSEFCNIAHCRVCVCVVCLSQLLMFEFGLCVCGQYGDHLWIETIPESVGTGLD